MSREHALCVSNNVAWYGTIFRSHGLSGAVADGMWTCRGVAPPYHSNAVTVARAAPAAQTQAIRELQRALGRPFTVADSFAVLDLAPLGFRVLFHAEWIWLDSSTSPPSGRTETTWHRVTSRQDLERWESAWRESGSPVTCQAFPPELLRSETLAFLAASRDDAVVAGCAAIRSDEVVGLSKFFAVAPDDALLAGALGATRRFAPGLPTVGYERGEDLARAQRLGFRTVGPHRVWISADG